MITNKITPEEENKMVNEEVQPTGDGARSERQEQPDWRYVETTHSAAVVAGNIQLHPRWNGLASTVDVRAVVRMAAAAPALYEALKATSCRYSRVRECAGPEMCDRCAALSLVDAPKTRETQV